MSTVTIRLASICSGGNHLTFAVTGDATLSKTIDLSVLQESLDSGDVEALLKVICKLSKNGRTLAQARTLLQTGVTVTV